MPAAALTPLLPATSFWVFGGAANLSRGMLPSRARPRRWCHVAPEELQQHARIAIIGEILHAHKSYISRPPAQRR